MARAKRTDRADARRRYRQTQLETVEGDVATEEPAPTRPARPGPATTDRPSITAAFRNAYHRADIRADIAALPTLFMTRSFLVSIVLVVAGAAAVLVAPTSTISALAFQALVYPPAMAPIFVVGFFSRRASYLLGLVVSVIDVAVFAAFVYLVLPATATTPVDPATQQQAVFSAISVGPISGIFFAAAAAWYRRFLQLSNANAARARQSRQQSPRSRAGRPARG